MRGWVAATPEKLGGVVGNGCGLYCGMSRLFYRDFGDLGVVVVYRDGLGDTFVDLWRNQVLVASSDEEASWYLFDDVWPSCEWPQSVFRYVTNGALPDGVWLDRCLDGRLDCVV